jgi:hypothetical protein
MPFDLIGYTESQDSATLVNVAALADQVHSVNGDNIRVPEVFNKIVGIYALGANTTAAEIFAPSLLERIAPNINPIDVGAEPASLPPWIDLRKAPLDLVSGENLIAQAAEDAAGAARSTILVWLADAPISEVVAANIITVRATNASTLTANAWTNGALTFDDNLERGTYQLVGARAESAGLQAFRVVFANQPNRPGAIGHDAVSDHGVMAFRRGGMGVWGSFQDDNSPTIDFLSNSADSSQVVWMDLIKVA